MSVESAGDEEYSEAVVVEVAETAGDASVEFDEAVGASIVQGSLMIILPV